MNPAASDSTRSRRFELFGLGVLVLLIGFSSAVRIHTALGDPNFDAERPEGMLKSDPALLYYITERVLEADGAPGALRADSKVQYPQGTDLLAEFTVGQEFLIAWGYRLFGGGLPLHVFCLVLMSIIASTVCIGAYLLARELVRSPGWALAAAVLVVLLPANYRTIGFLLVREDLSFPLFALHLGLLARAARVRTPLAFLFSGLALAGAVATWHAMGFFLSMELAVIACWSVRSGRGPFCARGSWATCLPPLAAGVLVPVLRTSGFLLSLPIQILIVLGGLQLLLLRGPRLPWIRFAAVSGLSLFVFGLTTLADVTSYRHVNEVFLAKLAHLGRLPTDPDALSFDARLLWQGPFQTLDLTQLGFHLGFARWMLIPLALDALVAWVRGQKPHALVGGLFVVSLPVAWFFERTLILPGLLLPVTLVSLCARLSRPAASTPAPQSSMRPANLGGPVCAALIVLQALGFVATMRDFSIGWYLPPGRQAEIRSLVEWVGENVPATEPIVADFMNSTAILAHAGNPIVLQPKYETERSRRTAQAFLSTFFHGTPAELRGLCLERFQSRTLLVDRYTLGFLSRYAAGLAADELLVPGSAAEVFLSQDEERLRGVEGFELLYRSPPSILQSNGEPYDFFRLYRLGD